MSLWDDLVAWFNDVFLGLKTMIDKLDESLGVSSAIQFHLDHIERLLAPLTEIRDWARDFRVPDYGSEISRYIDEKFSRFFGVPVEADFFEALWAKTKGKIDVWISGKFGVPVEADFFEALWAKLKGKIDVWISGKFGIDPAKPFWDELAQKIDVRISQKFGVDPALPFFDALWQKIEKKVDVWFSGKLGVDPALPFWDELEKKIIALAVKIFTVALDAVLPDADFWEQRKKRVP